MGSRKAYDSAFSSVFQSVPNLSANTIDQKGPISIDRPNMNTVVRERLLLDLAKPTAGDTEAEKSESEQRHRRS